MVKVTALYAKQRPVPLGEMSYEAALTAVRHHTFDRTKQGLQPAYGFILNDGHSLQGNFRANYAQVALEEFVGFHNEEPTLTAMEWEYWLLNPNARMWIRKFKNGELSGGSIDCLARHKALPWCRLAGKSDDWLECNPNPMCAV